MTDQPVWELIYATDYSALYRDTTGVYPPELSIAQTDDDVDSDDIEAIVAYVYRFPLDRCYLVTEHDDDGSSRTFLCEQDPARASELPYPLARYVPWFAKSLGDVARSVGFTVEDLTLALCSDDPSTLARAYEDIGAYHGYDNFDGYAEEWTAHEFAEWPERGEKLDSTECDAFTAGYLTCALWANALAYKHSDTCPCDPDAGDKPDEECTCEPYPELVSAADAGGPEPTPDDLTDDAREHMTSDAHAFYADNVADIRASTLGMEQAGHDFSLTRNRHGTGFWDRKSRGPIADAALDRLTKASHAYGEESYLVGRDGNVSVM